MSNSLGYCVAFKSEAFTFSHSPTVNSTFGKINTVPVKITSDNPADPVSTEIIVSLALVVSVLVCFTVITSVWLFVKCRRRLAWEVCESIEDNAAGKFSLLNGQKSEVQIPENLQILRKNIRIQKTIGRISVKCDRIL